MEQVLSIMLFALACNLDTLLLSFTYALRGIKLSWRCAAVLAASTSVVTGLALGLGELVGVQLNGAANALGALVLLGMGLWTLLDWMRGSEEKQAVHPMSCMALGAALAMNNAGVGVAAGVSGIDAAAGAAANFAVTLVLLVAGRRLACWGRAGRLARLAVPASGVLMAVLGLLEL